MTCALSAGYLWPACWIGLLGAAFCAVNTKVSHMRIACINSKPIYRAIEAVMARPPAPAPARAPDIHAPPLDEYISNLHH